MSVTRVQQRPLAWLALCAFMCTLALPVLDAHPMGFADDAACRLVSGSTDDAGSRIVAPESQQQAPEHCVVCHLQRALGGAFVSGVVSLASPFQVESCLGLGESHPLASASAAPSSRGPPAVLLSI